MQALIPPHHHHGTHEIAYFENFLTDEEINFILSVPQWAQSGEAAIGDGANGVVDKEKRVTTVGWMGCDQSTQLIWGKIVDVVAKVNSQYFHYDLTGCFEPAQLGIYKANDTSHYTWHSDDSPTSWRVPRKLSMSLLLDDPSQFEGGELQVMYQDEKPKSVEQKRGRAWFFPSWMLHRVTPVTKGIRRSLVLWVGGPAFK